MPKTLDRSKYFEFESEYFSSYLESPSSNIPDPNVAYYNFWPSA